jgi:GTP-binding protein EngB required for normal cell division
VGVIDESNIIIGKSSLINSLLDEIDLAKAVSNATYLTNEFFTDLFRQGQVRLAPAS